MAWICALHVFAVKIFFKTIESYLNLCKLRIK